MVPFWDTFTADSTEPPWAPGTVPQASPGTMCTAGMTGALPAGGPGRGRAAQLPPCFGLGACLEGGLGGGRCWEGLGLSGC